MTSSRSGKLLRFSGRKTCAGHTEGGGGAACLLASSRSVWLGGWGQSQRPPQGPSRKEVGGVATLVVENSRVFTFSAGRTNWRARIGGASRAGNGAVPKLDWRCLPSEFPGRRLHSQSQSTCTPSLFSLDYRQGCVSIKRCRISGQTFPRLHRCLYACLPQPTY